MTRQATRTSNSRRQKRVTQERQSGGLAMVTRLSYEAARCSCQRASLHATKRCAERVRCAVRKNDPWRAMRLDRPQAGNFFHWIKHLLVIAGTRRRPMQRCKMTSKDSCSTASNALPAKTLHSPQTLCRSTLVLESRALVIQNKSNQTKDVWVSSLQSLATSHDARLFQSNCLASAQAIKTTIRAGTKLDELESRNEA